MSMSRRGFVKGAIIAAAAQADRRLARGLIRSTQVNGGSSIRKLNAFNYQGVTLTSGRLRDQFMSTRNFYFNLPNDDILKGFREEAGLPAPGEAMRGTISGGRPVVSDMGGVFGQWLSGMAHIYRATGDVELRDKAVHLMTEWAKACPSSGAPTTRSSPTAHYVFDKTVCGLVDMARCTNNSEALTYLDRLMAWGMATLSQERALPDALIDNSKKPVNINAPRSSGSEWYTLSENVYLAFQLTNEPRYRSFAEVWHYPQYWSRFTNSKTIDIYGLHAYSHVNTLSSAAMTYAISGDPHYLDVITSAYDHFQKVQNYATGGFGPVEQLVRDDGMLGTSLEFEDSSFETGCGSWAVFKLGRYLLEFTGQARYGDWIENMLYNGISAALPMADKTNPYFNDIWSEPGWGPVRGRTFYYSDYRLGGAHKDYYPTPWPCCSGTHIQDIAEYPNLIYFHDPENLYVNLFVPSKVEWNYGGTDVTITQKTDYPESESTALTITVPHKVTFGVKLRVPQWTEGASVRINGSAVMVPASPGSWADLHREWSDGDVIEFHLPMHLRTIPIDKQHLNRVAFAYGPVVLVQEETPSFLVPAKNPETTFKPADGRLRFLAQGSHSPILQPFYSVGYATPYSMYFDID